MQTYRTTCVQKSKSMHEKLSLMYSNPPLAASFLNAMLLGLRQVFRGYVGDRSAPSVFEGTTQLGKAFNTLGEGYQRPFELATLRLQNMAGILPKCDHHPNPPC